MAVTREALRERLERERKRLLEEIENLDYAYAEGLGTTTEYESYGNHMADVGTETFEKEKGLALEWNLRRLLRQTEDALQRFDRGSYGVCAECGQPIPLERLEAVPHATLCIKCKKREELRH